MSQGIRVTHTNTLSFEQSGKIFDLSKFRPVCRVKLGYPLVLSRPEHRIIHRLKTRYLRNDFFKRNNINGDLELRSD